MRSLVWALLGCVLTSTASAQATDYRPTFQPGEFKTPVSASPNQVMILASPFLQSFVGAATRIEPVLDRLDDWQPTSVATEDVSGIQCDLLRRQQERYQSAIERHCFDTGEARRATGLDVLAANAEIERLLSAWPTLPSPAQRRRLASLFLAAGEPVSAVVQWLRLPEQERKAGDGLTERLVGALKDRATRKDESYTLGAALAARLGLERVHSIGDQSASLEMSDQHAYDMAIADLRSNPAAAAKRQGEDLLLGNISAERGLLDLYRHYNAADRPHAEYESDFGPALADTSGEGLGRIYVARWEAQNLRMASHIREALTASASARMLVVVRARHKGYLEAYLNQMHDVQLVDPLGVLTQ